MPCAHVTLFMPFMFIAPRMYTYTWAAYVNLNNKQNDETQ